MLLSVLCKNCKKEVRFKKKAGDRVKLEQLEGKELQHECHHCTTSHKYLINEIWANESKTIAIIAFLIFFLGTGLMVYFLKDYLLLPNNPYNILAVAEVLLIPSFVYVLLMNQERDRVRRFNMHRI